VRLKISQIYTIIGVLFVTIYIVWYFFFNIYEVSFFIEPKKEKYHAGEQLLITLYPLNSFGKLIKKREVAIEFEILDGDSLLETEIIDKNKLKIKFLSNGNVKIRCDSKYSLKPTIFNFSVESD